MQILDLSVSLNEQTPVYPGDPSPKIASAGILAQDGYNDHVLSLGTHIGTHIDAPLHMIEGAKNLSEFPIEQFVGRGICIQVGDSFELDMVQTANIQPGDIVLFNTGKSNNYHDPSYFTDYPAISPEIAQYLVSQKVKMVGFDTCSADNQDGFPIHKLLLGGDVLIIENLTNLDSLVGKNFTVYALPLKLEIDGSPARVIAQFD